MVEDVDAYVVDDRCLSLFSLWLTRDKSMWPQSADDSLRRVLARGLGCCCMIWSAATENAGTWWCRCWLLNDADVCCLVMQELVCKCLLLDDVGTGAGVDAGICCWVILEQVLLVCYKCGWLLRRRLVVSSKVCNEETRGNSQKIF